jgi:hypothetical protein
MNDLDDASPVPGCEGQQVPHVTVIECHMAPAPAELIATSLFVKSSVVLNESLALEASVDLEIVVRGHEAGDLIPAQQA